MAFITMNYASKQLKMDTLLTIITPHSARMEGIPLSQRKVLWLLHGLSGDANSWPRYSRIEEYARDNDLVVIMPSGARSMYCDDVLGQNYFSYIAEELPEYMSLVFNLSRKKEDNYIAGLSMGGLGAMKIALTYPERYSAVGSFSGLLDFEPMMANIDAAVENEFPFLLPAKDDIKNSPLNPPALLDAKKDKDIKIYVACGLQDDLLYTNQTFKDRADELGIDIKFVLEDGTHVWEFWDRHVKLFIDYMLG